MAHNLAPSFIARLATISLALTFLVLASGVALAAGPAANGPLHMTGQAVVDQSQTQQHLVLSADASDGSGWRLDAILIPQGIQRDSGQSGGGEIIVLAGTYDLSGPGVSVVTGQATGQVNQAGVGQVQLTGPPGQTMLKVGGTPLVATFAVHDAGQLDLDLSGQLPAPPVVSAPAAGTSQPVDHTFWYVSRAAGFTAYILLTLTVCLGLMVRTRFLDALVARWRSFDLHQFTALLALGFVALHIFSLLGDQYIGFQFDQLFIPLSAPYRPTQVAIGIIALYLMVVVIGSFYVRRSISYGTWRTIHYSTFGIFLLALAHGVLSGTDSGQPWANAVYWGTGIVVAALTLWRFRRGSNQKRAQERPVLVNRHSPAGPSR